MPEGDTVWLATHNLNQALAGATLLSSDFRVPELATVDLSGRQIQEVLPRGKHLLIRIEPDLTLHSHLRMDGSWHLYRPGVRWAGVPDYEVRLILRTAEWVAVGYRLHDLALVRRADEIQVVGHLGPDLLGPDWDLAEALKRLTAHPDEQIGTALLEQRNLAGIGNIYKNESLFLAKVNPWTAVRAVPDLAVVIERAQRLLTTNRKHWSQSTTGDPRPGHEHWVYLRAGRPCRRCGTKINQAEQGAALFARVTFWCPACQPGSNQ